MDDDQSSNDVIIVESNESHKHADRPIVQLFKSLITNDSKQNTVLTNAQLMNILQKEFDIDIQQVHDLEVEIYMNVVKKYLKDWPEWDKFELAVIELKSENNENGIQHIIEEKYSNLKEYLQIMLENAKLLVPSVLKKLPQKSQPVKITNEDNNDIVVEVQATRSQLNNLILQHPINNNSIFNCEKTSEFYNNLHLTLDSVLNWGGINVEIKIQCCQSDVIFLKYENRHKLKHSLVNKKLQTKQQKSELNQQWQVKLKKTDLKNRLNKITKRDILQAFEQYLLNGKCAEWKPVMTCMHKILKNITKSMPSSISIPADFRNYLSKHSFVRYLYKDVKNVIAINGEKYDLQLEEVISPMCQFHIGIYPMQGQEDSVEIHCSICQLTLTGVNVVRDIENHFRTSHHFEPDWQCMNCNEKISMSNLTKKTWQHKCKPKDDVLYNLLVG